MSVNDIIAASLGGVAPISLVAHVTGTADANTDFTTGAINTSTATLLVAAVATYGAVSGITFTDSKGNTWTAIGGSQSTNPDLGFFYCANPTVGSNHTFTVTKVTSGFPAACVSAWKLTANAAADASNAAHENTLSTLQPGSITPSQANCLVLTAIGYFDQTQGRAATISAGYTILDSVLNLTASCDVIAYQIQTAATATNPTWTCPQNQLGISSSIVAFKHV